jgi:hypothetical protein
MFIIIMLLTFQPHFIRGFWMQFSIGTSKLGYTLDDVYSGVETTLRGGITKHIEYFELQQATDVCMMLATKFVRTYSSGIAQFACSRYAHWIMSSSRFSFFEKLIFCYRVFMTTARSATILLTTIVSHQIGNLLFMTLMVLLQMMKNEEAPLLTTFLNSLINDTRKVIRSQSFIHALLLLDVMEFFQIHAENGLFRGFVQLISKWLVMRFYQIFHMTNISFYFLSGLSVRYVTDATEKEDEYSDLLEQDESETNGEQNEEQEKDTKMEGTVKQTSNYGVNSGNAIHDAIAHKNLLEMYSTYNRTHFMFAMFLISLEVSNILCDFYPPYISFQTMIALTLMWAPFVYNAGSFTLNVAYRTWVVLYSEDNWIIKTWIVRHCSVRRLAYLIHHNYYRKQLILEYDSKIEQGEMEGMGNLELDLDLMIGGSEEKALLERKDSVEDHKTKVLDRNKRKTIRQDKLIDQLFKSHLEIKSAFTKKPFRERVAYYLRKIPRYIARVMMLGEQLVLLALLTLCKYYSYLILLLKIIFPSAPPDYEQIYRNSYERRTMTARLNNIDRAQQPIKKKKKKETHKEVLDRMKQEKNALLERQRSKLLDKLSGVSTGYDGATRIRRKRKKTEEPLNVMVIKHKQQQHGETGEKMEQIALGDISIGIEIVATDDMLMYQSIGAKRSSLSEAPTRFQEELADDIEEQDYPLDDSMSDTNRCRALIARYVPMSEGRKVLPLDTNEKIEWLLEQLDKFSPRLIHEVYLMSSEYAQPYIVRLMDDLDLYRFVILFRDNTLEVTDHVAEMLRKHCIGDLRFNSVIDSPSKIDFMSNTFSKSQKEIKDEDNPTAGTPQHLQNFDSTQIAAHSEIVFGFTDLIKRACHFMCEDYRTPFCKIMLEPIEVSNARRHLMTSEVAHLCADLILQNVGTAELLLCRAREFYIYAKEIMAHEEHESCERCPSCRARAGTFERIALAETSLREAITVTTRFLLLPEDIKKVTTKPKSILKKKAVEIRPRKKKDQQNQSQYVRRRMSVAATSKDRDHIEKFVEQHFPVQDDEKVLAMYDDEQYDRERDRNTIINRNRFITELCELMTERIEAENLPQLLRECDTMLKDATKTRISISSVSHARNCSLYSSERKVMFLLK